MYIDDFYLDLGLFCGLMVFNATFNNISVISVSFIVGGNRVPGENHRPAASH